MKKPKNNPPNKNAMAKKKKITISLTGLKIVTLHDTLTGKFHKAIDIDVSEDSPFIKDSKPLPNTIKVHKTKIIKPKKK